MTLDEAVTMLKRIDSNLEDAVWDVPPESIHARPVVAALPETPSTTAPAATL